MTPPRPGVLARIATWFEQVAVVCLLAMTALIIVVVLTRNFLVLGLPQAEELARFCGIALVFLAAPLLLVRGAHISVDFFPSLLPRRARRLLERLVMAAVAVFCAAFLVAGGMFISGAWRFATPALGIPNWVFYLPVLVGVALMGLVALAGVFGPAAPDEPEGLEQP